MRIRITTEFIDLQAYAPDETTVTKGTEITVTAKRGAELVGLRLAEEIGGTAPRKRRQKKATTPMPTPAAAPAAPAAPADPSLASQVTDAIPDPGARADSE